MKPTIGISAGDPAGIGLEVTLKALPSLLSEARWILFSDRAAFERSHQLFCPALDWTDGVDSSTAEIGLGLTLSPLWGETTPPEWGCGSPESGSRALAALEAASTAALSGRVDAIVTAPVNKQCIGRDFQGQTEFLAERAGAQRFAMAFFTPTLKVVLATRHMALIEAVGALSTTLYVDLIRLTASELRRMGNPPPRIALAALNPHAGENGQFGSEEREILQPAVEECRGEGIEVSGPYPADSIYARAHAGEFDVVLAPYHDQGLIPVKLVARHRAANVTLGLPYLRTSPDHGTAFAIAGQGTADADGMETALRTALDLSARLARV